MNQDKVFPCVSDPLAHRQGLRATRRRGRRGALFARQWSRLELMLLAAGGFILTVTGRGNSHEIDQAWFLRAGIVMCSLKQQEPRMQAHQYAALVELGEAALASSDVPPLMQHAAGLVARTLEVEYSRIMALRGDGGELVVCAGVGWDELCTEQALVAVDATSPAGYTLITRRPAIVEDWAVERRFDQSAFLALKQRRAKNWQSRTALPVGTVLLGM